MEYKSQPDNVHYLQPRESEPVSGILPPGVNDFLLKHNNEIEQLPDEFRDYFTDELTRLLGVEGIDYDALRTTLDAYQRVVALGGSTEDVGARIGEPEDAPDPSERQSVIENYEHKNLIARKTGKTALRVVASNSDEAVARAQSMSRHPSARKRAVTTNQPIKQDTGDLPAGVSRLPRRRSRHYPNPLDDYTPDK